MSDVCILCGNSSFTKQFDKGGWDIVKCNGCGLMFVWPLPDKKVVDEFYNEHKESTPERIRIYLKTRISRDRRDQRKLQLLEKIQSAKGRILDIGCGMGLFVKNAADRGWKAQGIDLDRDMIDYGRKTFGVDISCTMLGEMPDGNFDVITLFNVIDHLNEPIGFLKEVARNLKPQGIIYANLHDAGGWKAKKCQKDWAAYCPPMHLYYYTPETLSRLVEKAGLKILMVPGFNLKEGIKVILVNKDDSRTLSPLKRKFQKYVYDCVQLLKL